MRLKTSLAFCFYTYSKIHLMNVFIELMFYRLRDFVLKHRVYSIVFFLYVLSIIAIAPWGSYAIGDDLYYFFQIQNFLSGDFVKNSYIDTSIILQVFIGYLWSLIFGANLLSLRILSIIFSLFLIFIIISIFKKFKISDNLTIIGTLLICFNPKFLYSGLSFNSEIYFLTFLLGSFYFLLKFNETKKLKYLLIFAILGGLSVSIRQLGFLILFSGIFVLLLNFKYFKRSEILLKIPAIFVLMILISMVGIFWPKHTNIIHPTSYSLLSIINYLNLYDKFLDLWKEIPYLSLYLSPFVIFLLKNTDKYRKVLATIFGLFLSIYLYQENVFNIGNVLYIEGIYARGYPILRDNLFNNLFIKHLLAFSFSFIFFLVGFFVIKNISIFKKDRNSLIILFTSLVYFLSIFIAGIVYDRYFIYFEIFFVIFFIYLLNFLSIKPEKNVLFLTSIYAIISVFYSMDFHQDLKIKWKFAYELSQERNIKLDEVFVQETFLKYAYIEKLKDYAGLYKIKPDYPEYKCFVSNDVVVKKTIFGEIIFLISRILNKLNLIENRGIFEYGYNAGQLKQCRDCKILKEESYFSPVYEIVGVSKFVKGYCLDVKK